MSKAGRFVLFRLLGNVWKVDSHSPGEVMLGSRELVQPKRLRLPRWP